MKRDLRLFVSDILSAMDAIESFVKGMSPEQLTNDDKTASAVIRKFEVIGEAAKNIPSSLQEKHPDIPWQAMAGMRDRLVHAYFGIDNKLVWAAIKDDIPKLKPKVERLLSELE